jgi:Nucleotidyltransferase of unknown function (DUF6036)
MDAALLDTCVLLKSYLCDTLLSIIVGGAAMALAYDATRVTRDVDSLFVVLQELFG